MELKDLDELSYRLMEVNGYTKLSDVQALSYKSIRKGKDVGVISQTGSGKTLAYLLPLICILEEDKQETQLLISAPTRELAYQIHKEALKMKEVLPKLKIKLLSSGTDSLKSKKSLANTPQVIIGTPGRLKALMKENIIRLDKLKAFVIDEADMTLEYGFLDDMDALLTPMKNQPQILCFSATFPNEFRLFAKKYLDNPQIIEVEEKSHLQSKINHIAISCGHQDYGQALLRLLPGFDPYVCLIFGNTREQCDEIYKLLQANDYKAVLLHGGLQDRERQKAMRALASQKYRYVIASDVAARGIDIEGISHVVSLGLPSDLAFYTHRCGRTGRSGREGTCFLLYKEEDLYGLKSLSKTFEFSYKDIKNGKWRDSKNPFAVKRKSKHIDDPEIAKIANKKSKVKPGYKKKKASAIAEVKRKRRRDYIRGKIKEEKKRLYKERSKKQ